MGRAFHSITVSVSLLAVNCAVAFSQPYYVATTGSDSNTGTLSSPFRTIAKAVSVVSAGETVYVRGGTYSLTATVTLSKNGTENALISLFAYPGEIPVLDFSEQSLSSGNRGVALTGSYWHVRGISITGAGDNGMIISGGSHNLIEMCNFYRNRDTGLQLDNGASDNTVRNCDSYCNADPPDYGDADGFAPKLTVGSGNHFFGCRAWLNCDDGWDGYLRGTDDVTNSIENCWSFRNGYREDGTDAGENANGNGFKMGGSDDRSLMHNLTLKNCLAFANKAKGFDQNNNTGSMTLYNCTGQGNGVANYRIKSELAAGKVLTLKNCAEYGGKVELGAFAVQEKNSWLSPFVVTADDFRSLDTTGACGPRKADGSLPHIEYMHLAPGSDLIDAGVDVGMPYMGRAPDLGCFETGWTGVSLHGTRDAVTFYPNPADIRGYIRFEAAEAGHCMVHLHDITGKFVKRVAGRDVEPGETILTADLSGLHDGVYICRVLLNGKLLFTLRILKVGTAG